jgi:predicted alpha-1,2-mannosidase
MDLILFIVVFINLSIVFSCVSVDKVNVFIASGGLAFGYGGVSPAAQFPNGALRLGPDTTNTLANIEYRHFSGYNYLDDQVRAFSHTHLVGAGINDLGSFGVMPIRHGDNITDINNEEEIMNWSGLDHDFHQHELAWWSKFNKTTESGSPGKYNVYLEKPKVKVSLLATSTHSAIHKYEYDATNDLTTPGVIFDVCHASDVSISPQHCYNASIDITEDLQSFTAKVLVSNKFYTFIYVEIDSSSDDSLIAEKYTTCSNSESKKDPECNSNQLHSESNNNMLFSRILFKPLKAKQTATLTLKVGISFINVEQAKLNLDSISNSLSFSELSDITNNKWCDTLEFLQLNAVDGDDDIETMLHSANYRTHMTPTIYTEVGGNYLGLDGIIHNANDERSTKYPNSEAKSAKVNERYSDFSFWDSFRAAHPWLLLTDENLSVGVLRSISEMTAEANGYPKWVLASKDIGCMVGLHGGALFLEAALSGINSNEIDVINVQKMLLNQATLPWPVNGRKDLHHYLSDGYVSSEADSHSTPLTLTYAFDDYILYGLSKFVGDTDAANAALLRSKNYGNVWSPENKYMCPRSVNGSLDCPKTGVCKASWDANIEGDTLHWSTFVMHDPIGLISLFESPKAFEENLKEFFELSAIGHSRYGNPIPNPHYWAGNEHNQFAVWLFNYGSSCTQAQYWSRNVTYESYSATPAGIPGNEDYGAMSSWLLFSSFGIYPQAGTTNYLIGSPRVLNAKLNLDKLDGTTSLLEVITNNNSHDNVYVQRLEVNGIEHKNTFIDRSILTSPLGCKLEFFMSDIPQSNLC